MATKLVIASGKRAGKAILLKRSEMLIGRAEECGIRLTSDEISRRHCSIKIASDSVCVEDLRSRNGTFVNGRRISEKTKLYDGDLLRVGSLELKISGGSRVATETSGSKAAPPKSWSDDDEISRWLLSESNESPNLHETTQVSIAVPVGDVVNEDIKEAQEPEAEADAGGDESSDQEPHQDEEHNHARNARMTVEELRAARAHPEGMPKTEDKSQGSSREAAAEALKKLFGNR
ncbi:MAG: FHA domain-containing protein [Pirellulales bacterium]